MTASYRARLMMVRLCSTATIRGSIFKSASNALMVSGPATSSGSPLTRMVKVYPERHGHAELVHHVAQRAGAGVEQVSGQRIR